MENKFLFEKITTFIFDVDGVFTDNSLLVTEQGELLRTMNARDGYAVKHALSKGYRIAIVTGGNSMGVVKRLEGLGIKDIHYGIKDKLEVVQNLISSYGLLAEEVLYMGDDLIDISCIEYCGLGVSPSDAVNEVKKKSNFICQRAGGEACVREIVELVLQSQNNWNGYYRDEPS